MKMQKRKPLTSKIPRNSEPVFDLIAIYLHSQFDGELHVDGFGLLATT